MKNTAHFLNKMLNQYNISNEEIVSKTSIKKEEVLEKLSGETKLKRSEIDEISLLIMEKEELIKDSMPNFDKNIVIKVDYNEIDTLISRYFNVSFEFIAEEESSNDSSHTFDIDGKVDKYDLKGIEEKKTKYMTRAYLNKLAEQGIIEKGEYLIEVSW